MRKSPSDITVCILAAGSGKRLGSYTEHLHKALLPLDEKAAISWIIEKFPAHSNFVIALGNRAEQVRNYLGFAHPDRNLHFVEVTNHSGPGSGPGLSLLNCRPSLPGPFYFVSCDSLWEGDLDFNSRNSWVGVARVSEQESANFCNVRVSGSRVISIHDKVAVQGTDWYAFTGIAYFHDTKAFWESLESQKSELIDNELQISRGLISLVNNQSLTFREISWTDIGTKEKYEEQVKRYSAYDFSKPEEALYRVGNRVIKFFANAEVSKNRVERIRRNPHLFPRIIGLESHFYAYEFVEGVTLDEAADEKKLKKVLNWLSTELWKPVKIDEREFRKSCHEFYKSKTYSRIGAYFQKLGVQDKQNCVNGRALPSTQQLLEKVPWEQFDLGTPVFFHGDLQFDHIVEEEKSGKFVLLDWRQDFGGQTLAGDIYYDLAKLLGGLILNYSAIKANRMTYREDPDGNVWFDFEKSEKSDRFIQIFFEFLREKGYDEKKVRMLTGLVFLNMSPLHHPPFDRLLHGLGKIQLLEALVTNSV